MIMLLTLKDLENEQIDATDGSIGQVKDFYFDDHDWVVRYLVVDAGSWMTSRKVLISPRSLRNNDARERHLSLALTREQVKNSPGIDTDKPVSRQYEIDYSGYYGYPHYWEGYGIWGDDMYPYGILAEYPDSTSMRAQREEADDDFAAAQRARHRNDNPNLRSCQEVIGYHIHASDGDIGHVESLLIDEKTWSIRYMVVNTSNWWLGRKVLIAPPWIRDVRWSDRSVSIDMSRDAVKGAPLYDASAELNRNLEIGLYEYYDRPGYWTDNRLFKSNTAVL
jgi:sporulation protein YlmC with PRC-barrel domain